MYAIVNLIGSSLIGLTQGATENKIAARSRGSNPNLARMAVVAAGAIATQFAIAAFERKIDTKFNVTSLVPKK